METFWALWNFLNILALKPSLEGWKLEWLFAQTLRGKALKPSLEGWKLTPAEDRRAGVHGLETFLRGMETKCPAGPEAGSPALKPSLEGWKPNARKLPEPALVRLETFLRGMETPISLKPARRPRRP